MKVGAAPGRASERAARECPDLASSLRKASQGAVRSLQLPLMLPVRARFRCQEKASSRRCGVCLPGEEAVALRK